MVDSERTRQLGVQWRERQETKGPKQDRLCYTCGSPEHKARDCKATVCHFCARSGHLARECTFGSSLAPLDQFVLCDVSADACDRRRCFIRRFVMPLHAACEEFDPDCTPVGRVDVGCRSVTAALFRSESYRRNTEIRLTFCRPRQASDNQETVADANVNSGRTVVLTGGLIRSLRPDERSVAERLRSAFRRCADCDNAQPVKPETTDVGSNAATSRHRDAVGVRCVDGGFASSLRETLQYGPVKTMLLLLSVDGAPIENAMSDLVRWLGEGPVAVEDSAVVPNADGKLTPPVCQVLVVLGDNQGLTNDEISEVETIAASEAGCSLLKVSLGSEMLLGSHCIVLLHHYLDRLVHCCPGKMFDVPTEVAKSRRQRQSRLKHARAHQE